MNHINSKNVFIFDENKIINTLKEFIELIKKAIGRNKNLKKVEKNISREEYFKKNVKTFLSNMEYLATLLEKDSLMTNEFHDFLEIQDISEYILRKNINTIKSEEIELIATLIDKFSKIFTKKLEYIPDLKDESPDLESLNYETYNKEYYKFKEEFIEYQSIFYTKIYTGKDENYDTAIEFSNLLK